MRRLLHTMAALAGLGLAGAAAVVGFGLYNVSAQVGLLPGVSWVLHTTFRNSVRLRAPSMEEAPDLTDPDLIALGAGHYVTACAMCHGTPDSPRSATARAMVPQPPAITEAVANWQPNELHWIVENGVKMTGMPAWPATGRGDEVWSVVAWLVTVRQETAPRPPVEQTGAAYCRTCHGVIGGPVPRLDILSPDYIATQLEAYRTGLRPSGIMAQAASVIQRETFAELAAELGKTEPALVAPRFPKEGEGVELARRGNRDVPACLSCHGDDRNKGPRLTGQPETYLSAQLRLWRDGTYTHDPLMVAAARDLTDAEIAVLSRYFGARAE